MPSSASSGLSVRVPESQKLQMTAFRRLILFWHRMLYSCTHMTIVSVK